MRTAGVGTAAAAWIVLAVAAVVGVADPARAAGTVVNVPSEVATIQAAIDAAPAGGTVLVAPGVYSENLDFHGKRVEVRSVAGPEATVIDGGGNGTVVLFDQFETRATVLRGFTVRHGSESGIAISNASPTVTGNVVTANSAHQGGGVQVVGGAPLIIDNVVRGNSDRGGRGGGFYLAETHGAEIVRNTVEHNRARSAGGGMAMFTAEDPVVRDNVLRENWSGSYGGAIDIVNYSDPLISQNVFVGNRAEFAGGAISVTVPLGLHGAVVANNTMVGNTALRGSSMWSTGDYFAVNNIINDEPSQAAVQCDGGAGRFFYNDVYNGSGTPFRWCPDTTGLVGNVSVDPRLAADLSLTAGSPLIDAGHDDPLQPLLLPADANGGPRVQDGNGDGVAVVDMGAFEWPGAGLTAPAPAPAAYHPLTPARILDTRAGIGSRAAKLGPGATLGLQVTGQGAVPPSGVSAVVLNVTVTDPTADSFLTAWPAGGSRPLASNLNYGPGQTVPNLVVVKVGAGGRVNLFNNAGATHVVVDVAGWYGPFAVTPGALYTPLPPARVLDTRTGLGAPAAKLEAFGTVLPLQVTGRGGVPPSGVSAVVLNVTVTEPSEVSFLTAWPAGDARPVASNLNYGPGQTVPNLVVVKVGTDGKVSLFNNAGSTHVIADVAGWYGTEVVSPAGAFTPVVPARLLDTRSGLGAPAAKLGPGGSASLQVTGRAGIPTGAVSAVVLNVTVTEPTSPSFLTAWPAGDVRPLASNLNYDPGQTVPNLVVVKVGAGGKVDLFNNAGSTHVVADVAGWFGS